MSKDDFPKDLTSEEVLDQLFDMIENWKNKLFDALSVDKVASFSILNQIFRLKPIKFV